MFINNSGVDFTMIVDIKKLSVDYSGIKALDVAAPGAETMIALHRGAVITPRMEMMLEGVGRRSFSFTFSFIPKSVQEAAVVKDIIYSFKFLNIYYIFSNLNIF